ncbi:AMIN-like domain-containing (lipo)protein [Streptomyces sp. 6N106]|uniref:AMIN-like domain-containing (lipo)protein n=1 Tax=Streptomyces sp. 6N106 TaxID=3457418 RepID=UPI003FD22618
MRRWGTALTAMVLAGGALAATAGAAGAVTPAAAGAAACETGWGSGDKTAQPAGHTPLGSIRTGRHACYDRMVFDVKGATAADRVGYRVAYVDTLYQDGSGEEIPVGGGAILDIHVAAPSYDPGTGGESYPGRARKPLPGVNVAGYQTFRDTRFGASFEGETQVGLGVRARLPFRVFQTDGRVVVDVAHSWNAVR